MIELFAINKSVMPIISIQSPLIWKIAGVISICLNLWFFILFFKKRKNAHNILAQKREFEKQKAEMQELNALLEKRQQRMEKQAETLTVKEKEMEELNELLVKRQSRIEKQSFKLSRKTRALQASNETKDKLFSIIAHDLKNPFNTILGFTDLVRNNFEIYDKEKLGEINQTLYDTTKQIFKLLENLLSWSRAQMGTIKFNPEDIEVAHLAHDVKNLAFSMAKAKDVELIVKVDKGIMVFADQNMIHTVLRNLVTNAIKFTENGSVSIIAEKGKFETTISIVDTGVGMSQEVIDNIFTVSKVKSRKGTKGEGGTGLGMIICKDFITKNKGQISASSEEGKGSTFTITLPSA